MFVHTRLRLRSCLMTMNSLEGGNSRSFIYLIKGRWKLVTEKEGGKKKTVQKLLENIKEYVFYQLRCLKSDDLHCDSYILIYFINCFKS